MTRNASVLAGVLLVAAVPLLAEQEDRDARVRNDREQIQLDESWLYDDFDEALAIASKENKPLLVVFR